MLLRKLQFLKTLWMKPPHQRPPLPLLNHLSITSGVAYYWGGSAVINGSPTFEWQTAISQSAHACATLYSFNHHFYLTVHNHSLKPCWNQDLTLSTCVSKNHVEMWTLLFPLLCHKTMLESGLYPSHVCHRTMLKCGPYSFHLSVIKPCWNQDLTLSTCVS